MKRKGFTEELILAIESEAAECDHLGRVLRRHGIGETTFDRWKATYDGMGLPEVKPQSHDERTPV